MIIKEQCCICGEWEEFSSQEEYDEACGESGPDYECTVCRKKWGREND